MPLSEVTTTFNIRPYVGPTFDARRTKIWATTNAPDDTIHDTSTGESRIGGGSVTLAEDGTATATTWAPGPDANPKTWQTTFHADYVDAGTRERKRLSWGPFTITTSGKLTDLVEEQVAVPTATAAEYAAQAEAAAGSIGDAATVATTAAATAQAAAAQAVDISNIDTPDSLVATLVSDSGSATGSALSASIAAAVGPLTADKADRSEVPALVVEALADDDTIAAAAAAAATPAAASAVNALLAGGSVMTATAAPALASNDAPDPQAKTSGGGGGSSATYDLTRITTGLPAGFAHGIQTVRKGTLDAGIAQHRHGDLTAPLRVPVAQGESFAATLRAWTDQASARARLVVSFLDAAGASVSGTTITGATSDIAASVWETRSITGTAPPAAAYAYVTLVVVTSSGNAVAGAVVRSTGLHFVRGASTPPATYGDGTSPGWAWTGAAHASASKKVYVLPSDLSGGTGGTSDADLIAWAAAEAFVPTGSIVRNSDGVVTSAAITWPDGSTGTFTATNTSGGYLNAYTATHVASGKKVTQPAVTRNPSGDVTATPAPTVGAI